MSLWNALENTDGLKHTAPVWVARSGLPLAVLAGLALRETTEHAQSVLCAGGCGGMHPVVALDGGRLVAVCERDGWREIAVEADDVVLWEADLAKLGRAIAQAWPEVETQAADIGLRGTRQVGVFGGGGLPLCLTVQVTPARMRTVVAELVVRWPKGFVLLAPTRRMLDMRSGELLGKVHAGIVGLDGVLDVMPSGRLQARKTAGELFSPYLPENREAANAAEVTRVFGLLMKLKSKRVGMKAPLYDVFVMVVLEDKSQREAARACGCTEGLMSGRVKELRGIFDRSIQQLKALRRPILEMQTAVKGDRRRKPAPGSRAGGFRDDDKPEEEGDGPPKEEYIYDPSENDA